MAAYELYNHKTGYAMGKSFSTKAEADKYIKYLQAGTSLKLHWRARKVKVANPRSRNGRSYVVKGEVPKRYWEPSQGDVVYIEGTRTKLGKPYADPDTGKAMFPLRPSVRGTTDMSAGNIKAIARVEATANPAGTLHYFMLSIYDSEAQRSKVSPQTLTRLLPSVAAAKDWAQEEVDEYGGVGYLYKDTRQIAKVKAAKANPKLPFRVMTAFGGKELTSYHTVASAKKQAKLYARTTGTPVQVWSTTGGAMGQGKVIAHYGAEKNPRRSSGTFKSLPVGSTFIFRGEVAYPYSGFARGPWIKTGPRNYTHAETGGKYRVGSINAEVVFKNPTAGVEAIPTQWTKATITARGKQIQIRTGGR